MSADPISFRPPVFIVGSPRSGTSILTWCLGQHPNLLGLEESNWMAPFAVDVAVAYRRGSARGERSQLSAMGIERDRFMRDIGASINASIVGHRGAFEDRRRQQASPTKAENHPAFKISRGQSDPKWRWVNGTPEYSFGIAGLRKLFPGARFIHLVRHPDLVVPSMLNFDRVFGTKLAEKQEEGYGRWLANVRACGLAENAFGAAIVCRVFHEDLVREPDASIRRIVKFIEEPFDAVCLEPLEKRINSSDVDAEELKREVATDSAVIAEARVFWKTLRETPAPNEPLADAAALLEEQFERRVAYIHDLDAECGRIRQAHQTLQNEFEDRTQWALRMRDEIEQKDKRIHELQKEVADRAKWALDLKEEIAQKDAVIVQLRAECAREDALKTPTTEGGSAGSSSGV